MEVDNLGRITYIGQMFHDPSVCGFRCVGNDTIKIGPKGKEIIKGKCIPLLIN